MYDYILYGVLCDWLDLNLYNDRMVYSLFREFSVFML